MCVLIQHWEMEEKVWIRYNYIQIHVLYDSFDYSMHGCFISTVPVILRPATTNGNNLDGMHPIKNLDGMHPITNLDGMHPVNKLDGMHPFIT